MDTTELSKNKKTLIGIFVLVAIVIIIASYFYLHILDTQSSPFILQNKYLSLFSYAFLLIVISALSLALFYQVKWIQALRSFINSEVTEKALLSHYQIITRYANDIILLMDQRGLIVEVNQQALKVYGYSRREMLNQNVVLVFAPKSIRGMSKIVKAFESREGIIFEALHRKKNGEEFPVEISARIVEIGGETLIQNSIRDISEKKKIVEELEFSQTLLQKVFDSLEETIFLINPTERKIENVNLAAIKTFGYDKEELLDRGSEILFGNKERFESFIKQSFSIYVNQDFYETELTMQRKNGEVVPVYFYGKALMDAKKKFSLIIGVVRDISLIKKTEQTLIDAKNKAEEMNRLKSNFLANMSHELRTPLISILGFAEILMDSTEDSSIQDSSRNILYGGRRLLETLNVILQFSKIEAEKVALSTQLFDVVASLRILTERYKIFAQQKNLNLFFENEAVDCYAESDRLLFEEIISQLLNNALKFTEEGTILVVLKKEEIELLKYFTVEISDTGIGISPENCQIIFDEFRQVSEGISRYYEGLGLGLTIVKKYTSLLNGKVELQSEVGVGSIFKLRFPMIEPERAELTTFTEEVKKPFSLTEFFKETKFENDLPVVLLVEDDPSTSDVITIFLRKVCRLEYANRADKAIQKASEKKYNAILMDINLGKGPSGKEAMELIKQSSTNSDTPVIAVTAYALENEKQTLLSAGFTDYISKPFDKNEIIEKLTSCLLKKN
ncbi:MAG: PAS domain S-box protein [Ignavibacteria bacterium]|nr:PAS domain S-box protein [Ignavibacteria bacterium]